MRGNTPVYFKEIWQCCAEKVPPSRHVVFFQTRPKRATPAVLRFRLCSSCRPYDVSGACASCSCTSHSRPHWYWPTFSGGMRSAGDSGCLFFLPCLPCAPMLLQGIRPNSSAYSFLFIALPPYSGWSRPFRTGCLTQSGNMQT